MPFELSKSPLALSPMPLLSLQPRAVSGVEYYHAGVGSHPRVFENVRNVLFAFEGDLVGDWDEPSLQAALNLVTTVHPVLRMRWTGVLGWSKWCFDGPPPEVRRIHNWDWDFSDGSTIQPLLETPSTLRTGPAAEVWISKKANGRGLIALKSHHAVMDGMGGLLLLQELFRALRGEPLQGSNVTFTDSDLMLAVMKQNALTLPKKSKTPPPSILAISEARPPKNNSLPDVWKTNSIGQPCGNLTGRISAALAAYAFEHNPMTGQVVVAMPVDLRRYVPGASTASNLTGMVHVKLHAGEDAEVFREKLKVELGNHSEVTAAPLFNVVKWLPLRWIARMVGRTRLFDPKRKRVETVVISNLGQVDMRLYSTAYFKADHASFAPPGGNCFCVLYSVQDRVYANLSVAADLGGEGTVNQLFECLKRALQDPMRSSF